MYCKTPIVQKAFHVWLYVQSSNNTNTTGGPQIVGNTNENVETTGTTGTTGPTVAEIVAMKLPQLRALCKQRKLKSSGNKPDLIALLINGK